VPPAPPPPNGMVHLPCAPFYAFSSSPLPFENTAVYFPPVDRKMSSLYLPFIAHRVQTNPRRCLSPKVFFAINVSNWNPFQCQPFELPVLFFFFCSLGRECGAAKVITQSHFRPMPHPSLSSWVLSTGTSPPLAPHPPMFFWALVLFLRVLYPHWNFLLPPLPLRTSVFQGLPSFPLRGTQSERSLSFSRL